MSVSKYNLVRFAEYASVSASVLGAIAAVTTRQIVYAVAPLSVSVALNLISRRQQAQRIEQHLTQTIITQVNQRLDRVSQQSKLLQQNLNVLTQAAEQQAASAAATDDTTEALHALDSNISQRVQALSNEIQAVRGLTEQQAQQISEFTSLARLEELAANLQTFQISLDVIAAQIEENLEQQTASNRSITRLEDDILQLRSDLASIAAQTANNVEQRLQNLAQTQQQSNQQQSALARSLTRVEDDILQLRDDLVYLRQKLEDLIPPDDEHAADISNIIPQLPTDENYDLEINLGIDFGTGFTKVCFRDLARDRSEIVTFANLEATQNGLSSNQTLIPSKLAILQDGTLLTGLTVAEWQTNDRPIRQSIDFIKMRLADLDLPSESKWRLEQVPELDNPNTVEGLCAYYLSQIIKRAQQWIQDNRPDLFSNQTVRWSVNVGVPVEHCDSAALGRFRRVLSLAWLINYTPRKTAPLTLPALNQFVAHLKGWMGDHSDEVARLDCNTTPEIAAAVWSFLSSREAQDGFYTFFDIGDGTLDGAAFRFWREVEGDLRVDFYSGRVRPLGVTAFTQQAATELNSSTENIRQALTDASDPDLQDKMRQSQIRRDVQMLVASVVIKGNKKHRNSRHIFVEDDLGPSLKVFVGGGGGNTRFFKDTIQAIAFPSLVRCNSSSV